MKKGSGVPAEGYLHLPQKQTFKASVFLERKVVTLQHVRVTEAAQSVQRVQMTDESRVTAGEAFSDWSELLSWNAAQAARRVRAHQVSPLDVDIELQEECCLQRYRWEQARSSSEQFREYSLIVDDVTMDVPVANSDEGRATAKKLDQFMEKPPQQSPTLYGLLHYARSRLIFQPLTFFGDAQPDYITLDEQDVDRAALLKSLKFR